MLAGSGFQGSGRQGWERRGEGVRRCRAALWVTQPPDHPRSSAAWDGSPAAAGGAEQAQPVSWRSPLAQPSPAATPPHGKLVSVPPVLRESAAGQQGLDTAGAVAAQGPFHLCRAATSAGLTCSSRSSSLDTLLEMKAPKAASTSRMKATTQNLRASHAKGRRRPREQGCRRPGAAPKPPPLTRSPDDDAGLLLWREARLQ
jgi:hypothetical protein